MAEQRRLYHDGIIREAQRLGETGPTRENARILRDPVLRRVGELDDRATVARLLLCPTGVLISGAADRQHDFLHHQDAVRPVVVLIAKPHPEVYVFDRAAQGAGYQLEPQVDTGKLTLQLVDAGHQPMRSESRGDRERDGFGASAPPLKLDQAAFDAAKSIEDTPIE